MLAFLRFFRVQCFYTWVVCMYIVHIHTWVVHKPQEACSTGCPS